MSVHLYVSGLAKLANIAADVEKFPTRESIYVQARAINCTLTHEACEEIADAVIALRRLVRRETPA